MEPDPQKSIDLDELEKIDSICALFEESWPEVRIEDALQEGTNASRSELLRSLIVLEFELSARDGRAIDADSQLGRFPDDHDVVSAAIDAAKARGWISGADDKRIAETVDLPAAGDTGLDVTIAHEPTAKTTSRATGRGQFGQYELLDEIARGGMGVVYKARQAKANRIVALKMILSGQLADDEEVRRFYAEAEAAAALDHPGIVPIFDVGQQDGQHYFSMGFVEGQSLADRIHDEPLPARQAAEIVKAIGEAVHYAHEKGIIHRDLKPGNVLLDGSGNPRVTDFGLAKQLDSGSELTATGQVMGTPSYMPPEQALGKVSELGPTADVYSLGAILYAVITGRPPFQAASMMETLQQVVENEPVDPRVLNPVVDKDLETICLKCLEKEADRRYQTTQELVDELSRFLSGEPILARPVSNVERSWRWCKRNPVVSSLLMSVAISLVVGISVSSYFAVVANERARVINQERLKEQAAKQLATQYKGEAIDRYKLCRGAIDQLIDRSEFLADLPATQSARKQMLIQATEAFEKLSHTSSSDPTLELERGRALVRLGDIFQMQENYEEARMRYVAATTVFDKVVNSNDPVLEDRRLSELANAHTRIGLSWDFAEDTTQAEVEYQAAIRILRPLSVTTENTDDPHRYLAAALSNLADLFRRTGRPDEAIPLLEESIGKLRTSYQINPEAKHLIAAAVTHETLGRILAQQGNNRLAMAAFQSSIAELQNLPDDNGEDPEALLALASIYVSASAAARSLGLWQKEVMSLESAAEVYSRLRTAQPDVPRYEENFAITQTDLGLAHLEREAVPIAARLLDSAQNTYHSLLTYYPNVPRYREGLAAALDGYAQTQMDLHANREPAIEALTIAGQSYSKLIQESPGQVRYFQRLAIVTSHFAQCLALDGDRDTANSRFIEAESILGQLIQSQPSVPAYRNALAHVYARHGDLLQPQLPEKAGELYEKAKEIWQSLISDASENVDCAYAYAKFLLRCVSKKIRDPDQAKTLMQRVQKNVPSNPMYLSLLAEATVDMNPQVTLDLFDKILELRGEFNTEDLCILSRAHRQLGDANDAESAIKRAKQWKANNRPESRELTMLIQEAEKQP